MTHYQVYLETSAEALEEGGYLAHVPELLGCAARGQTKEQALANVREAISAILAVMRRRGMDVPPAHEPIELKVTETEALTLPPDYAPMRDDELDDLWERTAVMRQELIDTLALVPPTALSWRERPDVWSVRNILEHMSRADMWYASRLEEAGIRELAWRLAAARAVLLQHLQSIPADQRDHVTKHDGEDWTPRKVARRMLEHEQEHLAQIREILKKAAA